MFWGVVEIGGGNLHRNYTDWEELQYDEKLIGNREKIDIKRISLI